MIGSAASSTGILITRSCSRFANARRSTVQRRVERRERRISEMRDRRRPSGRRVLVEDQADLVRKNGQAGRDLPHVRWQPDRQRRRRDRRTASPCESGALECRPTAGRPSTASGDLSLGVNHPCDRHRLTNIHQVTCRTHEQRDELCPHAERPHSRARGRRGSTDDHCRDGRHEGAHDDSTDVRQESFVAAEAVQVLGAEQPGECQSSDDEGRRLGEDDGAQVPAVQTADGERRENGQQNQVERSERMRIEATTVALTNVARPCTVAVQNTKSRFRGANGAAGVGQLRASPPRSGSGSRRRAG